jgi:surface antigen
MEWLFVPMAILAFVFGGMFALAQSGQMWTNWVEVTIAAILGALVGACGGAVLGSVLWLARSAHLLATQPA